MNNEAQCKCWQNISCLNDDTTAFTGFYVNLYNPTEETGAYLQVRYEQEHKQEVVRIRYCPLCGRFLK